MLDTPLAEVMTQGYLYVEEHQATAKALAVMRDMNISCMYVMRESIPTGIITERTIVRQSLSGKDLFTAPASSVMSRPLITLTPEHSVLEASDFMIDKAIRHLGIVDSYGNLRGTVTPGNIVNMMDPEKYSASISVKEVMSTPPVTVKRNWTLEKTAAAIAENNDCCAVIMDGSHAVGIISEKDIARCIGYGEDINTYPLERIMSKRVIGVDETDSISDAILTMRRHHIQRVMVFNEDISITGFLSLGGLIHCIRTIPY